jgi:hypothetical protein
MIDFKNTMSTKLTKQEKQNSMDMAIIRKYKALMAKAKESKTIYIELKAKDTSGLTEANKESLKRLTASEYNDALEYYNKAQDLKAANPNIIK